MIMQATSMAAVAESLALAKRLGVDPQVMTQVGDWQGGARPLWVGGRKGGN